MRQEPEDIQPIVYRDRDDPPPRHALAVVSPLGAVTRLKTAAVKINQHRQPLLLRPGRRPDVEVEAIFAHAIRAKAHVSENWPLHRPGAEFVGLAHTCPVPG